MATIYHRYEPGDSTFVRPQTAEIKPDYPQVRNPVRRLSEQSERRLSEERRRSSVISEKTSVIDGIQSMREGRLPTNDHLNRIINRLLNSKTIENNKTSLSSDGQLLLKDFQELLITFQHALQTKNRDELFQSMIYHVNKSEIALAKRDLPTPDVQEDEIKTDAKSILTIAKLFLFNSQFRSILEQILTIAQQTMGDTLQLGGRILHDNAKTSANKILSSYSATDDQTDSAANRDTSALSQENALDVPGIAALAGGASSLDSKEDKLDLDQLNVTTSQKRDLSLSSALHHNNRSDQAHIPVPEEHMDFLSHRFAEIEHGAPVKDDGGNIINSLDTDNNSKMIPSASKTSSRFEQTHGDNLDLSFLHNRLDDTSPVLSTTTAAEKVSLAPKTSIGVGAGCNLNEPSHAIPSNEMIDVLRRKRSASYAGAGVAGAGLITSTRRRSIGYEQVNRRASNYSAGQHVMDRLDENPTGISSQPTTYPSKDQTKTVDAERTADPIQSGMSAVGTAGAAISPGTLLGIHEEYHHLPYDSPSKGNPNKNSRDIKNVSADQSIGYGSDSRMKGSDKESIGILDNTTGNIQKEPAHPDNQDNTTQRNASDKQAISQSTDDKSRTSAMAAVGAGVGAMMANRDSQSNEISSTGLQPTDDKCQSIVSSAINETTASSQNDTSIITNKPIKKVSKFMELDTVPPENADEGESTSADEIIHQLKEVLTKVQQNTEYQQAISSILSLFSNWSQRLKSGGNEALERRRSSAVNDSEKQEYYLTAAAYEAQTIIEDWAQGKSLNPLIQKGTSFASKLEKDGDMQKLYERVIVYAQRLLKEPGYLVGDQSTKDGKEIVKEIRRSTFEKYKPELSSMIHESNDLIQAISDDPTSKDISQKIRTINSHLWYDRNGNAAFKPQLLNDIRITLIPALVEQVKYVPLPQVVYSDKQYDVAIENMILEGNTLMPDLFEVKVNDVLRFSPKANLSYINAQSMQVHMTGIQTMMDDVVFYYKKKTGFPRVSDAGVVSIHTGGTGIKISTTVVSSSVDQKHTFRVDQCHCYIDKLHIKIRSSKHNALYKVFNPVLTGIVKRQMAKAIETKLTAMLENGDAKITEHLFSKQDSRQLGSNDTRPGFFSHLVNLMNQRVAVI